MASIVVAIGVVIYISAAKVHESKEKKRALKAQGALERGLVEELSTIDDITDHLDNEHLQVSHKERLPPYHIEDQHLTFHTDKRSARHPGFCL
jgi:hypothetical protein